MNIEDQLAAFVLAQIEWELEKISQRQYVLARRRAQLQEWARLLAARTIAHRGHISRWGGPRLWELTVPASHVAGEVVADGDWIRRVAPVSPEGGVAPRIAVLDDA